MSHNITVEGGSSIRLTTAGKYCDRDIVVTAVGGAEDLDAVLTEQESLIDELKEVLEGKAAGGGGTDLEDGLITRTLTEYENNRVTTVGSYAFSNWTSIKKVSLTMVESLPEYAFVSDTNLKTIDILGGGTFYGTITSPFLVDCMSLDTFVIRNENAVTNLKALIFPRYVGKANITRNFPRSSWNTYGTIGRKENWGGLTANAMGSITYLPGTVTDEASKPVWLFGKYANSSSQLETLALAETEDEANALILQYMEHFISNGTIFYVPSALVDSYKSETNWSVYADRIRAIEDYPEITGGA